MEKVTAGKSAALKHILEKYFSSVLRYTQKGTEQLASDSYRAGLEAAARYIEQLATSGQSKSAKEIAAAISAIAQPPAVRIAEETSPPKASGVIWLEGQKGNRDEKENAGHDRTENARVKLDVSMDADEAVSTANISPAAEVAQPEPPPVQQLAEQFKQAGILVPSAELEPEWDLDKDQIRAAAKIGERGEESE